METNINLYDYNKDYYQSQMPTESIATKYGISCSDIKRYADERYGKRLGRSEMFWSEDEQAWVPKKQFEEEVFQLARRGMSSLRISKMLNIPYFWVNSVVKGAGIESEESGTAADDKIEADIYKLWKTTKMTTEEIAKATKQSEQRVITILHLHGIKFKDAALDKNYIRMY